MSPAERSELFAWLQEKEQELLLSKGKDYAGDMDVLSNFKRNAERLGLTKYQVWAVYAGKHIDAILNSIRANPLLPTRNAESLEGSVLDARNYLGLLACLVQEDLKGNEAAEL